MSRFLSCVFILISILLVNPVFATSVFIEPGWLDKKIGKQGIILIDMSSDDTQYERFHLPGARYFRYHLMLDFNKKSKFPKPVSNQRMAMILGQFGITRDSHIVLYDDMGGLNAGRLFWHLERMGHRKVSVLNGGLVKWILSGRKVTNQIPTFKPARYLSDEKTTIFSGKKNHAHIEDIKAASKDLSSIILDVRSDVEYLGDSKKRKGGHIPGARWWPWQQAVDFKKGFTRANQQKIEQSLQQAGVTNKQKPVIAYCRSGHRAGQTYLTLRSLGYENIKLYANSMNEYGRSRSKLKQGKNP